MMDPVYWYGSAEADAIQQLLGVDNLATLRLALRQAHRYDAIGNRHDYAILYRKLGGTADLTAEVTE